MSNGEQYQILSQKDQKPSKVISSQNPDLPLLENFDINESIPITKILQILYFVTPSRQ